MTNEKLLEKCSDLFARANDYHYIKAELNKMICDLKNEIMCSTKAPDAKKRLKYCLGLCEKQSKIYRLQLAVSHHENGVQYWTDSHFAVKLSGDDILNELPRDDQDYQFKTVAWRANQQAYPTMTNVFKIFDIIVNKDIDVNALYNFAVANKNEEVVKIVFGSDDQCAYYNPELFIKTLTFANMLAGKIKVEYKAHNRPLKFSKDNGTEALITPLMCGEVTKVVPTYSI